MIEIELDGKKVEIAEGSMVMHAADKAGTYIPHLLSQETEHCGELPYVFGGRGKNAQANAGLCNSCHATG